MIPVCPKCDCSLLILRLADVEVDYCDRCHGVWLDAGELEALAGNTDPLLPALHGQPGIPPAQKYLCPRCDAPLEQLTAPGTALELERCPQAHGLWFDAGELKQLLETFPSDSRASSTVTLLADLFAYKQPTKQGG